MRATSTISRLGPTLGAAMAIVVLLIAQGGCSVLNRDGPDVTCADLGDGGRNECKDGIIATCDNGRVRYRVCSLDVCDEVWQIAGRYRCEQAEPVPQGTTY